MNKYERREYDLLLRRIEYLVNKRTINTPTEINRRFTVPSINEEHYDDVISQERFLIALIRSNSSKDRNSDDIIELSSLAETLQDYCSIVDEE